MLQVPQMHILKILFFLDTYITFHHPNPFEVSAPQFIQQNKSSMNYNAIILTQFFRNSAVRDSECIKCQLCLKGWIWSKTETTDEILNSNKGYASTSKVTQQYTTQDGVGEAIVESAPPHKLSASSPKVTVRS